MGNANYPREDMSDEDKARHRLYSYINICGEHGCWEYSRATTGNGYAHLSQVDLYGERRTAVYGHRLSWALENGRWPTKGEVIRHEVCDNPPCINPAHLEAGTQKQNVEQRPRSGRWFGMATGKLTPEQVQYVRQSPKTQIQLAKELNISQTAISNIRTGKSYGEDGTNKMHLRQEDLESFLARAIISKQQGKYLYEFAEDEQVDCATVNRRLKRVGSPWRSLPC